MTLSNNVKKKKRQTQKSTHHMIPFTKVQKEAQLVHDVRTQDCGCPCRQQRWGWKRPWGHLQNSGKYTSVIRSQYYSYMCVYFERTHRATLCRICVPLHVFDLKIQTARAGWLSGLELCPNTPRLPVRSLVRAHTYNSNQRMHKYVEQQIDVFSLYIVNK